MASWEITLIISCLLFIKDTTDAYNTRITDDDSEPYKEMPEYVVDAKEKDKSYWHGKAQQTLDQKVSYELNKNTAKNIIFFLGDGMSIPTIAAARIYEGQQRNKTGEEHSLFFEDFPFTGLSKTYCTDRQVADSACTATAYMCGVKANFQTIGVTAEVKNGECEKAEEVAFQVDSIIKWAQQAGKATGIVTTTRITHATPSGGFAHIAHRNLESDADVVKFNLDPKKCHTDIAKQLIYREPGKNIKVLLGGGRMKFLPKYGSDSRSEAGERLDGENLIQAWEKDKASRNKVAKAVFNRDELMNVDVSSTEYLLGLFAASHISYKLDANRENEPTLEEMTRVAIEMLKKEEKGFFLFIEGGKIDIAHHDNLARLSLEETVEFSKAIKVASEMTSEQDTLIVVTSDHSHVMSFSGYPDRGTNILKYYGKGSDNLTYATLSYANGPGYREEKEPGVRHDIGKDDMSKTNYVYPAMVPKAYESHGGDDVAVYARGPWAHLFAGSYEQNYIPVAEAYAANIGPFASQSHRNSGCAISPARVLVIFVTILTSYFTCWVHLHS